MVDIAAVVAGFPGVQPVPGLSDCWTWSAGRRFHFTLALSADGMHALQVNSRDHNDPELVRAVLAFAREHSPLILDAAPLAVVEGFTHPPAAFDVVAGVIPAVHRYHAYEHPELNDVTYAVFPGYRCEFSGLETQQEAALRFDRMLDAANLLRNPRPWVRMRYDNPKTGGGSVGPDLGITTVDVLMREIPNLVQAEGAYLEFENFRGQRRRLAWADGIMLGDGDQHRPITLDDAIAWAHRFVYEGVDA